MNLNHQGSIHPIETTGWPLYRPACTCGCNFNLERSETEAHQMLVLHLLDVMDEAMTPSIESHGTGLVAGTRSTAGGQVKDLQTGEVHEPYLAYPEKSDWEY